jgi:hypothetical protein
MIGREEVETSQISCMTNKFPITRLYSNHHYTKSFHMVLGVRVLSPLRGSLLSVPILTECFARIFCGTLAPAVVVSRRLLVFGFITKSNQTN